MRVSESVSERVSDWMISKQGHWELSYYYSVTAMEYYRKATKIVPDIDIQMTALYRQSMAQTG